MWRSAETGRAIPMRPRSFPNKCSWITYELILSNKPGGRWESRSGTAAPGREFDWHRATLWNDWHDLHEKMPVLARLKPRKEHYSTRLFCIPFEHAPPSCPKTVGWRQRLRTWSLGRGL